MILLLGLGFLLKPLLELLFLKQLLYARYAPLEFDRMKYTAIYLLLFITKSYGT